MRKCKFSVLLAITLIIAINTHGISGRHDKKESEYIKLGKQFKAVGQVIGWGSGVLNYHHVYSYVTTSKNYFVPCSNSGHTPKC